MIAWVWDPALLWRERQCKVTHNGNKIAEYFFDGEGKRVKKKVFDEGDPVNPTEETVFVYSNGKLIAEYSTAQPPPNPTTSYTATDQLGSPRVITNSLGEVVSRRDFKPFGEQVAIDGTYRSADLTYNSGDGIRQKFTGYQKDEETQLDFAEARMYENRHGRFTAVDPLLASGKSANPQTFNRYVYVTNNPLLLIDPTGLQVATAPRIPRGRWYMPNGDGRPVFSATQPENSEPITTRNRHGDLVYTPIGAQFNPVTGLPYTVVRLNESGPQISLPVTDVRTGRTRTEPLTDFNRNGWELIQGDQLATGAVQDVSLELVLGVESGVGLVRGIGANFLSRSAARSFISDEVSSTRFWSEPTSFEGTRVFQRNDIFDPNFVSSWTERGATVSGTNMERMAAGRAPIGLDGRSVELHHLIQTDNSALAEMTSTFHRGNSRIININPPSFGSGITRPTFNAFRSRYWANRALDFTIGR